MVVSCYVAPYIKYTVPISIFKFFIWFLDQALFWVNSRSKYFNTLYYLALESNLSWTGNTGHFKSQKQNRYSTDLTALTKYVLFLCCLDVWCFVCVRKYMWLCCCCDFPISSRHQNLFQSARKFPRRCSFV